jgi:hypothetical protein
MGRQLTSVYSSAQKDQYAKAARNDIRAAFSSFLALLRAHNGRQVAFRAGLKI